MKITSYKTSIVPPRWLFLKIETDEGIVGWGEPVLEGKAHTVETAVHEMMDYLLGEDPHRIEDIWQKLYRGAFYRGGAILMSALAGIDQALWDIKGKCFNTRQYTSFLAAAAGIRSECTSGSAVTVPRRWAGPPRRRRQMVPPPSR